MERGWPAAWNVNWFLLEWYAQFLKGKFTSPIQCSECGGRFNWGSQTCFLGSASKMNWINMGPWQTVRLPRAEELLFLITKGSWPVFLGRLCFRCLWFIVMYKSKWTERGRGRSTSTTDGWLLVNGEGSVVVARCHGDRYGGYIETLTLQQAVITYTVYDWRQNLQGTTGSCRHTWLYKHIIETNRSGYVFILTSSPITVIFGKTRVWNRWGEGGGGRGGLIAWIEFTKGMSNALTKGSC